MDDLQATEAEIAKAPEASALPEGASDVPTFERNDSTTFAALQPLPMSPSVSPPASIASPGSTRTNNPFERLAKQTTGSRPASPLAAAPDIFSVSTTQLQADTSSLATSTPPRAASPFRAVVDSPLASIPPAASADPFGFSAEENPTHDGAAEFEPPAKAAAEPVALPEEPIAPVEAKEAEPEATPRPGEPSPGTEAAAAFPPLSAFETAPVPAPSTEEKKLEADTDLDSKLVEKEIEDDSDSDSDDDGEFHDAKEARTSIGSPGHEDMVMDKKVAGDKAGDAPEPQAASVSAPVTSNFDDAFGLGSSQPAPVAPALSNQGTDAQDLFFTPPSTLKGKANGRLPETSSPFDSVPPLPNSKFPWLFNMVCGS